MQVFLPGIPYSPRAREVKKEKKIINPVDSNDSQYLHSSLCSPPERSPGKSQSPPDQIDGVANKKNYLRNG